MEHFLDVVHVGFIMVAGQVNTCFDNVVELGVLDLVLTESDHVRVHQISAIKVWPRRLYVAERRRWADGGLEKVERREAASRAPAAQRFGGAKVAATPACSKVGVNRYVARIHSL